MKLSEKREQWAKGRREAKLVGKPLVYPAPVAQDYERRLKALVERMGRDYERELRGLYKRLDATPTQDGAATFAMMDESLASQARIIMNALGRKWAAVFNKASRDIVGGFIDRLDKFAKKDAERSLEQLSGGLTIEVPQWPGGLQDRIKASVTENVKLITNIPAQYAMRIESAVLTSIQSGQEGSAHLFREISKIEGMSIRRAHLIATDQTRKVTSAMNVERMKSAGVRRWRWLHSGGGAEPRPLHKDVLNGQEFSYDDEPPVIDERTGERGYPGQLINCRCVQVPVIDFSEGAD